MLETKRRVIHIHIYEIISGLIAFTFSLECFDASLVIEWLIVQECTREEAANLESLFFKGAACGYKQF